MLKVVSKSLLKINLRVNKYDKKHKNIKLIINLREIEK